MLLRPSGTLEMLSRFTRDQLLGRAEEPIENQSRQGNCKFSPIRYVKKDIKKAYIYLRSRVVVGLSSSIFPIIPQPFGYMQRSVDGREECRITAFR